MGLGVSVCGGDMALSVGGGGLSPIVDAPLSPECSVGGDGDMVDRYAPSPPE